MNSLAVADTQLYKRRRNKMARLTSAERLTYVQKYVHDIFADTLKQEGFVSPDGKDTIWYRGVNHEVVNTVCFFTRWSGIPISLWMGYGIHPLFVEPFRTNTVYIPDYPYNYEKLNALEPLSKEQMHHYVYYALDVPVHVPKYSDKGLYTLEGIILPKMNAVKTERDCYELHKARYLDNFGPDFMAKTMISLDFVNEAIFFEDTELYPGLQNLVLKWLQQHENYDEELRNSKWAKERRVHLEYQKKALLEDDREAFLESMAQRRNKTVDLLQKKFKIDL